MKYGVRSVGVLRTDRGLSLIELTIAVFVIAILAALAVPIYKHFTAKAKMAEGEAAVFDVRGLEQQYFSSTHGYSNDLGALGYAPMPALRFYTLEVRLGDPADAAQIQYQVVALAKVPELDDWYLSVHTDGTEDLWHEPPETALAGPSVPASSGGGDSVSAAPSGGGSSAPSGGDSSPSGPSSGDSSQATPSSGGESSPAGGSSGGSGGGASPVASGGSSPGGSDKPAEPSSPGKKPKKKNK